MKQDLPTARFVDSIWARLAAVILLLVWIASMSMPDDQVFTQHPMAVGLALVCLLVALGLIAGKKIVRLPLAAWLSLGVGVYFLLRSLMSYSVLEGESDAGIILACMVFYVAGVYAAQLPRGGSMLTRVLILALVLNILAWFAMNKWELGINYLGRAQVGLAGENSTHMSLFHYKNFAGAFFFFGGAALIWRVIWGRNWKRWGSLVLGIVALALSLQCETRAVYFLLPVVFVVGWMLWLMLRLFTKGRVGWLDGLFGVICVTVLGFVVYDFFFGATVSRFLTEVDTHLRFQIWGDVFSTLPDAPLWGYGAGASQWEIVPFFNEWNTPNYAHNEYIQAACDYGTIGLVGLLFILLIHMGKGYLLLSAEEPSKQRRTMVALALFLLSAVMMTALTDFIWHQYAMATLSAFCCGVLVSPVKRKGGFLQFFRLSQIGKIARLYQVKAEGWCGRAMLIFLFLAVGGALGYGAYRYTPIYAAQWRADALAAENASPEERAENVLQAAKLYPAHDIVREYARLAQLTPQGRDVETITALLERCLENNPKELFVVLGLVEYYASKGEFEKSESLMRRTYPNNGPDGTILAQWHTPYGLNLIYRGFRALSNGDEATAYSMLDYAMTMHHRAPLYINVAWRDTTAKHLQGREREGLRDLLAQTNYQLEFLRMLGVEKNDSWQAPQDGESSGALYKRYMTKK